MEDSLVPTDIIPPSEIQSELTRLWESLETSYKMRACLFNLVFYTKKKARAEYIQTISQKVIEKFPARILFITEDPEENQNYLNTRVDVVAAGEDLDIACDSIQIDVAGKFIERVPFVILPHFVPDIPVYVIWAEDPTLDSPLFQELKQFATRLIFDSESTDNLSKFAHKLINIHSSLQCDIADLNWGRMESWRNLLASTFYSQERLQGLYDTQELQLLYNAKETQSYCHTQVQAIYLQAWLANQLGWKFTKMQRKERDVYFNYEGENSPITISLFSELNESMKAGTIISADLTTRKQEHFSFGRDLEIPNQVSMRFSTLEKCEIPLKYIFAKEESGQSLVKEICRKGTSQHYLSLLNYIQNIEELAYCEYRNP